VRRTRDGKSRRMGFWRAAKRLKSLYFERSDRLTGKPALWLNSELRAGSIRLRDSARFVRKATVVVCLPVAATDLGHVRRTGLRLRLASCNGIICPAILCDRVVTELVRSALFSGEPSAAGACSSPTHARSDATSSTAELARAAELHHATRGLRRAAAVDDTSRVCRSRSGTSRGASMARRPTSSSTTRGHPGSTCANATGISAGGSATW
jgi:hypothetical protein